MKISSIWFDEYRQVLRGNIKLGGGIDIPVTVATPENIVVTADHLRQFAIKHTGGYSHWNSLVNHIRAFAREADRLHVEAMCKRGFKSLEEGIRAMSREDLEKFVLVLSSVYDSRDTVLNLIPPCPAHGQNCHPHQQQWIEQQLRKHPDEPILIEGHHDQTAI